MFPLLPPLPLPSPHSSPSPIYSFLPSPSEHSLLPLSLSFILPSLSFFLSLSPPPLTLINQSFPLPSPALSFSLSLPLSVYPPIRQQADFDVGVILLYPLLLTRSFQPPSLSPAFSFFFLYRNLLSTRVANPNLINSDSHPSE